MISQLSNALQNGFTADQVVDYILKKFPAHKKKIEKALSSGFNASQILSYLSRNSSNKEMPEEPGTEFGRTRARDREGRESRERKALAAGTLAAGAVIAPIASQAVGRVLSNALPHTLTALVENTLPSTLASGLNPDMQSTQQTSQKIPIENQTLSSQQPPSNQISQNIPQVPESVQPKGISNPTEYLEKLGIKDRVDMLLKSGNTPEGVAAALGMKRSGQTNIDPELLKNVEEYAKITPKQEQVGASMESPGQELDEAKEIEGKIEKNSIVASPKGIGTIRSIKNNSALIDIDGKLQKVNIEDLESEPKEVKDSKFDFDISSIPEELRSAPLNEVYLPYDKRHVTVKYNAGLKPVHYMYFRKDGKPIGNEYINKIVQGTQLPISSGLNFWGAWDANKSDSRGGANYQELVSNAQEEGEKDDPSKEYWFIKEEALYEHPYIKKAHDVLKTKEKEFNEERKKRKKKAT